MAELLQFVFEFKGTLIDYPSFVAEKDAEILRGAMKGLGTDEDAIIEVVANRTLRQRLEIENLYKQKYGRDLIEDLKSELGGNFEDVVVALFYPESVRDARFLHQALSGAGTDDECLIEILTTRTNNEIKDIKDAYKKRYDKDLEEAVKSDTSGHFKNFLVILLQANRSTSCVVDSNQAKKEAQELYEAGEKFWGTDETKFNEIFCSRSFPQLRATFYEYEKISGNNIKTAISKEFSGDLEDGLKAIVEIAVYLPFYFARRLKWSMEGLGTDDDTLIRIVTTRCEYDMFEIKDEFKKLSGKSLYSWIKDDTSGDYRRMLLSLVGK